MARQEAGRPLLWHVLAAAAPLKADRTVVVVGNGADQVTEAVQGFDLGGVEFAVQASQRGTGDALAATLGVTTGSHLTLELREGATTGVLTLSFGKHTPGGNRYAGLKLDDGRLHLFELAGNLCDELWAQVTPPAGPPTPPP